MDTLREIQVRQRYEALETTFPALTPEELIQQIIRFIQEFPDHAQAHNDLAVLLYQQGELLQALGRFERAVKLAPHNRTFRKNLADFYFVELGWTDDAIFLYTDLLKEDQADIETLGALSIISTRINRPEEARLFLRRILDLAPWNSDARNMLNSLSAPDAPVALVVIPTTSETDSVQDDVNTLLAELRQSVAELSKPEGQPATADFLGADTENGTQIFELENQLRDDPTNPLLNNDLGVLYLERGDLNRSCAHHEMACRYAPQNLTFRKNLAGVCSICEGKMDRAIELLTQGLKEYPNDTELLAALAQISVKLGRREEALIFMKKVLDLEPWNQDARSLMSQIQKASPDAFFLNR
jgi:cytochrome c-type biogenesis protein CcmH/NrfG